jgi:hypothetical protein
MLDGGICLGRSQATLSPSTFLCIWRSSRHPVQFNVEQASEGLS